MYIYIESGFPIITCTSDHTYLVIGKENKIGEDNVKLVTINDNERPYKLIGYNEEITSFIVPLYEKYIWMLNDSNRRSHKSLEEGIPGLKIKRKTLNIFIDVF